MNITSKTHFIWSLVCALIISMFIPLNRTNAPTGSTAPVSQQAASPKYAIFKRTASSTKSIHIADKILNNQLYVSSIWPAYPFKGSLTWKENPYHDPSWCFYFHSLDTVGYLMNAYEKNPSQDYLKKAKWYIDSWIKANPSPQNQASAFAWSDHSTANRVTNIIYFWQYYKKSKIYDKAYEENLMNLLEVHGDFLANNQNYTKGMNHGIYQDRSLIELALLFPNMKNSQLWYETAMSRLLSHVYHDVTRSGIHKEHSPAYHLLVLNLFKGIDTFLIQFNKKEPELKNIVVKMEDYLAYLAKPDGDLPIMGDSEPKNIHSLDSTNISSPALNYVLSKGIKGKQPANDSFYPDGGVAIFRNGWNIKDPLYILFTAAFHSNIHKHADDLSFLFTYGKTNFFVDSGKYNYIETNPYRQYFKSTMAHNTITVDGKSYPLTNVQSNKAKIHRYQTTNHYSYVTGSHSLYRGITIQRTLIYLKRFNSLLIRDVINSNQKHAYRETFNVGKDVQIIRTNHDETFILKSKKENKQIEFKNLNKANDFKHFIGSKNPIAGWQSILFNQKYPIAQLQFTNYAKEVEFTLVINTHSNMGVQTYTVKNNPTNDLYTIVYKDGKQESIQINK